MSGVDDWTDEQIRFLACEWLREIREGDDERPAGDAVVLMNFTASPNTQWDFLLRSVEAAESEEELGAIAAGPFEHLMGQHGGDFIDRVEAVAGTNDKFARMTKNAWQHMMSDDVWARVQVIQSSVTTPE